MQHPSYKRRRRTAKYKKQKITASGDRIVLPKLTKFLNILAMKIKAVAARLVKYALWTFFLVQRGSSVPALKIRGGPAKGTVLSLDLRSQGSYWLGTYDDWIFQRIELSRFVRPGDAVWDCGAFVGYYTSLLRLLVGPSGRVISFEASKRNYKNLVRLPALNDWSNVTIVNIAIGPDHSSIKFAGEEGGGSGPRGLTHEPNGPIDDRPLDVVQSCGVDELVFELGYDAPSFIKFDLETGEIFALNNGDRVYSECRPTILLELHGREAADAAGRFLQTHNYLAAPVHLLPMTTIGLMEWNNMFRKIALHDGPGLRAFGYDWLTVLCIPEERVSSK